MERKIDLLAKKNYEKTGVLVEYVKTKRGYVGVVVKDDNQHGNVKIKAIQE